jgi:hypothetical protein
MSVPYGDRVVVIASAGAIAFAGAVGTNAIQVSAPILAVR